MENFKTFYEWLWDEAQVSKSVHHNPCGVEHRPKEEIIDDEIVTYAQYAKAKNEFLKKELNQELKKVERDLANANKIIKDHEEEVHRQVDEYFKKMGVRRNR